MPESPQRENSLENKPFKKGQGIPDSEASGMGEKLEGELSEIPKVDKSTGVYTDEQGERWKIALAFENEWLVTGERISKLRNIRSMPGRDKTGHITTLYNEKDVIAALQEKGELITRQEAEKLPQVDRKTGAYIDEQGERWRTTVGFARNWSIGARAIIKLENVRSLPGLDRMGRPTTLYNEKDVLSALQEKGELITRQQAENLPQADQAGMYTDEQEERWRTTGGFKKEFIADAGEIAKLEGVRVIKGKDFLGRPVDLYNEKDVIEALKKRKRGELLTQEEKKKLPQVDKEAGIYTDGQQEQWSAAKSFSVEWFISEASVKKLANVRSQRGLDQLGRPTTLYNKGDVLAVLKKRGKLITRKEAENLPRIDQAGIYTDEQGERWRTTEGFAREWLVTPSSIRGCKNARSIRGRLSTGNIIPLYNEKDVLSALQEKGELITREEAEKLPQIDKGAGAYIDEQGERWRTTEWFLEKCAVGRSTIQGLKTIASMQGRDSAGRPTTLLKEADVLKALTEGGLLVRAEQKKEAALENELVERAAKIAEGHDVSVQEFRKLIGLFGASCSMDILFRLYPEFRDVPPERVKRIIAEYLGDFLVTKTAFHFPDIAAVTSYLSEPVFEEAFFEVVKNECLAFYSNQRDLRSTETDRDVIDLYFWQLEGHDALKNPHVQAVVNRAQEFYRVMFEDTVKPANLVDHVTPRRSFPDIFQSINIREIADKKRMLIADQMGLGKSAAAIIAKESLGVRQAIIAIPSNVEQTWLDYLSSKKAVAGGAVGYFREGNEPRVLMVENPESLLRADAQNFDYVLIHHERLTERYAKLLVNLNADMLIVDEVHKLKNIEQGVRAKTIMSLAHAMRGEKTYLALLSGTPVPNKVKDIAIVLKLLYPEELAAMGDEELVGRIIHGTLSDIRTLLLPRMQMKTLEQGVEMPRLTETITTVELSAIEQEVYGVLIEEDEVSATVKLKILRQFLLNPELVDATPSLPSAKIAVLQRELTTSLAQHDKVVVFVNDYIEGVIRGETSILSKLSLPGDVIIRIIEGGTSANERAEIQREFQMSHKRIVLFLSGQTVDVGQDFSAGKRVLFYNEPWTRSGQHQQLGRVYRPGLCADLESSTLITRNTMEEGMHRYLELKDKAIEKLLHGIPITEREQELLGKSERQVNPNLEVNKELAEYYFSRWDKLMKLFAYGREIGEEEFTEFLEGFGKEYAELYRSLGRLNYQSNVNRVVGTLIDHRARSTGQEADQLTILDIASGPEMLRGHITDAYQQSVTSMDINKEHFSETEGAHVVVGSFRAMPFDNHSCDYATLSLALQYTKYIPSRGIYERLEVLREMNRILKTGGIAIISMPHSLEFKHPQQLRSVFESCGFEIRQQMSGQVVWEDHFRSEMLTLKKVSDIGQSLDEQVALLGKEALNGLKLKKNSSRLKDSRRLIKNFELGEQTFQTQCNVADTQLLHAEERIRAQADTLKAVHGSIKDIPKDLVIKSGFTRIFNGNRYVLFKIIEEDGSVVVVR